MHGCTHAATYVYANRDITYTIFKFGASPRKKARRIPRFTKPVYSKKPVDNQEECKARERITRDSGEIEIFHASVKVNGKVREKETETPERKMLVLSTSRSLG